MPWQVLHHLTRQTLFPNRRSPRPLHRHRHRSRCSRRYRSLPISPGFRLDEPQQLPQFLIHRRERIGVILQELTRILAPLPDPLALVAEPRSALLDHVIRYPEIDQIAFLRNSLAVDNVELGLAER